MQPPGLGEHTHELLAQLGYSEQDIGWIVMLTRLRGTGMPIQAVREYADLVRAGQGNERERLVLLVEHRERVLRQLEEVQEHLAAIDFKIDLYRERIAT